MVVFAASGFLGACGEITDNDRSSAVRDTVLLYSLSNADYFRMPSAYDVVGGRVVIVEDLGPSLSITWDLALVNDSTEFSFLMPGALQGQQPTSSILAIDDTPFDAIREAPTEGYDSTGVAIDPAAVYVLRTRRVNRCRYYAKLEPLAIDTAAATLRFHYLMNPNCSNRMLILSDS